MSKANGTATAITAYGKIPAAFDGVDHVSMTTAYEHRFFGPCPKGHSRRTDHTGSLTVKPFGCSLLQVVVKPPSARL